MRQPAKQQFGKSARRHATAALTTKLADVEKAKKAAEAQVKDVRANQEAVITQRLAAQRETLAKQMAEAVNAEKKSKPREKARGH